MQRAWPADAVERRPVASLLPYARNARTHSADQVAQIAAAIREWGWTVPVLVDEAGQLIAGHGRVLAAKSLGLLDVPAMVARGSGNRSPDATGPPTENRGSTRWSARAAR